jgi:hypothetical protein
MNVYFENAPTGVSTGSAGAPSRGRRSLAGAIQFRASLRRLLHALAAIGKAANLPTTHALVLPLNAQFGLYLNEFLLKKPHPKESLHESRT